MSKTKLFALILLFATVALAVHVASIGVAAYIATSQPNQESYKDPPPRTGTYSAVKWKTTEDPQRWVELGLWKSRWPVNWMETDDPWAIKAIEEYEKYNETRWVEVDQEKTTFDAEDYGLVKYNEAYYGVTIAGCDCFEGYEDLYKPDITAGIVLAVGWVALGVAKKVK